MARLLAVVIAFMSVALAACSSRTPTGPSAATGSTSTTSTNESGLAVISGRVYASTDTADRPIPNATVEVTTEATSMAVQSNSSGQYALAVPRGTLTITASKEGYTPKSWQIDATANVVLNFSLAPQ